ncbi:MAG: PH domain-containing protein [Pseudomonadota bacterium]
MATILPGDGSHSNQDKRQHKPRRMKGRHLPVIEFRSSTMAWLFKSGQGWQILAATAVGFGIAAYFEYAAYAAIAVAVLAIPYLTYKFLRNRTSIYWLDGDRLFMRRGIIMRAEEEVELYRIKDVKVTFSIIQQMFDNGDLVMSSSDKSSLSTDGRNAIIVRNVPDARSIRGEIRDRVEMVRQQRGVRELDIG